MKKMFLIKSAVLLVLAAMVVVGCGKSPEELKAQLKELENNSSEAYSVDGDTEKALTLAKDALKLAQQMQKKGLLDAVEVKTLESKVGTYTAEITAEKTMSPTERKLVAEYKKPAEVAPESDFEVKLNNDGDGALITKYTGPGGNIIIPATIQGMPVTEVDMNPPWQKVETGRHTVIQNAIKSIYSIEDLKAAEKYYNEEYGKQKVVVDYTSANTTLLSVVIPEGVKAVGGFKDCIALRSVTLPSSVTTISGAYERGAFSDCTGLASIVLPEGIKTIGEYAFWRSGLTSITIPGSVMEIGKGAFKECTIASLTIADGVKQIGVSAFQGCTSLESVSIPGSVTKIEGQAFYHCTNLASLTIANGVTWIGGRAFSSAAIESVVIPDSVMNIIGYYAFGDCTSLVTVTISPVKRERFDSSTFANCPKVNLASQAAIRAAGYTGGF